MDDKELSKNELYTIGYRQAIDELSRLLLKEEFGCSDGGCVFKFFRGGMVTNGGCRCRKDSNFEVCALKCLMIVKHFIRDGQDRTDD